MLTVFVSIMSSSPSETPLSGPPEEPAPLTTVALTPLSPSCRPTSRSISASASHHCGGHHPELHLSWNEQPPDVSALTIPSNVVMSGTATMLSTTAPSSSSGTSSSGKLLLRSVKPVYLIKLSLSSQSGSKSMPSDRWVQVAPKGDSSPGRVMLSPRAYSAHEAASDRWLGAAGTPSNIRTRSAVGTPTHSQACLC